MGGQGGSWSRTAEPQQNERPRQASACGPTNLPCHKHQPRVWQTPSSRVAPNGGAAAARPTGRRALWRVSQAARTRCARRLRAKTKDSRGRCVGVWLLKEKLDRGDAIDTHPIRSLDRTAKPSKKIITPEKTVWIAPTNPKIAPANPAFSPIIA